MLFVTKYDQLNLKTSIENYQRYAGCFTIWDWNDSNKSTSTLHLATSIVKRDTWGNNKNVSNNPVAPQLDYFWHQVAQTLSGGCQLVFTSSDISMVQTWIIFWYHHGPDLGLITSQLRRIIKHSLHYLLLHIFVGVSVLWWDLVAWR